MIPSKGMLHWGCDRKTDEVRCQHVWRVDTAQFGSGIGFYREKELKLETEIGF